jgi:hypothetical protein
MCSILAVIPRERLNLFVILSEAKDLLFVTLVQDGK